MAYKVKQLIDGGYDLNLLSKDEREDIDTIKSLSNNFADSDADAQELDSLVSGIMVKKEKAKLKAKKDAEDKIKAEADKKKAEAEKQQKAKEKAKKEAEEKAKAEADKKKAEAEKEAKKKIVKKRKLKKATKATLKVKPKRKVKKKSFKKSAAKRAKNKKVTKIVRKRKLKGLSKGSMKKKSRSNKGKKRSMVKRKMKAMPKHITKAYSKSVRDDRRSKSGGKQFKRRIDLNRDRARLAKTPGKRISAEGNTYYEYRANRSDLNKKLRLAEGGGLFATTRPKSAVARDRKYVSEQDWEKSYSKNNRRSKKLHYKKFSTGGEVKCGCQH